MQKRFPSLTAVVKMYADQIRSLDELHAVTDALFDAKSTEEARQIIDTTLQHGQKRD